MPRFVTVVRRRADVLAVIAAGGALGTVARWGVGQALPTRPDAFPWATFSINVSGSFVLGAFAMLTLELTGTHRYLRPFVAVGVLGGFTTFSTSMLETRTLVADSDSAVAIVYLTGSVLAGLLSVVAGVSAGRAAIRLRQAGGHRGRQS